MSRSNRHSLAIGLTSVLVLATGCAPAWAQESDHAAHHPAAKPAASPSSPRPADPHAGHLPTSPDKSSDDHGTMNHGNMRHGAANPADSEHTGMDHSTMDHSEMDHSGMDHASMGHQPGASQDLPATTEPHKHIPVLTPADRAAAFKNLDDHVIHGESINSYWSLDRLEAWDADEDGTGMAWEAKAWVG